MPVLLDRSLTVAARIVLLALAFSPSLRAQNVDLGGTGALGNFLNPLTVTTTSPFDVCNYDLLQIDLAQGKVFARPFQNGNNTTCNSTALVDITSQVFQPIPPSTTPIVVPPGFPDGVLEVGNFTLQRPALAGATAPTFSLEFLPNANNTPVIIRSNGPTGVTIDASTTLRVAGKDGGEASGTGFIVRGAGGAGGPGGYRGGDGGNGGVTPTRGMSGFGPGGGLGGPVGTAAGSAKFLTTGVTLPSTPTAVTIPTTGGADLATQLRGGSGGGGGGGTTNSESGRGGGGGGGAILIAANNTITVNGTISAQGGNGFTSGINPCNIAPRKAGSPGTGGIIRLVAGTIAGSGGGISVAAGSRYDDVCNNSFDGVGADNGLIRLEAYNITITSTLTGPVGAASQPGVILMPGDTPSVPNPFIRFARIKDVSNTSNCVSLSAADSPCRPFVGSQTAAGRTGLIPGVDATMPSPGGIPASTVNVDFIVGPIPGFPTSPTNPNITLVVAALDPAQGAAVNYTAAISLTTDPVFCPTSACKTSLPNVTFPLGFSSMSAFVVLNLTGGGTLARMFPRMIQGEAIESVRVETTGSDTKYVLIAKSGKEFPYKPGR